MYLYLPRTAETSPTLNNVSSVNADSVMMFAVSDVVQQYVLLTIVYRKVGYLCSLECTDRKVRDGLSVAPYSPPPSRKRTKAGLVGAPV